MVNVCTMREALAKVHLPWGRLSGDRCISPPDFFHRFTTRIRIELFTQLITDNALTYM